MDMRTVPERRSGRWAAAAAAAAGAAHLAMVPGGGWMAALGAAMAAACLPCAWHLWRRPSLGAARTVIGMSLAMVLVHGALLLSGGPGGGHAHAHHPSAGTVDAHAGAMLAIIAVELGTALLAAAWVRRQRTARAAVMPR
jgi:hypothetical protein